MNRSNLIAVLAVVVVTFAIQHRMTASADQVTHDPFGWMETKPEALTSWLTAQSKTGQAIIGRLAGRDDIERRIQQLTESETVTTGLVFQNGRKFFFRQTREKPYSRLFVEEGGMDRLLIDPPRDFGIAFYFPSPNGRYVAYGLSKNGTEAVAMRVFDVEQGSDLADTLPTVRYPNVSWRSDSQSFFYTRLARDFENRPESERYLNSAVFLHHMGTNDSSDEEVFAGDLGDGQPADTVSINTSQTSAWIVGVLAPNISGESGSIYAVREDQLDGRKTPWKKIADRSEGFTDLVLTGDSVYLAKPNEASGYSIVKRSLDRPKADLEVLNWNEGELNALSLSSDSVYVAYISSAKSRIVRIPLSGEPSEELPLPYDGMVDTIYANEHKSSIVFRIQGWVRSPLLFEYNSQTKTLVDSGIIQSSPADFGPYIAEEKWVKARDGVLVPLTIIRRRDMKFDSSNATWLTAYGAYGVSIFPYFDAKRLAWLEQGGIIAIAHVRGGGELGPQWHEAGRRDHKVTSVNDFLDCADYLISEKYTRSQRLVASGASAGGIVVGMALATRPDLFSAVAIKSGILNALRLEEIPIGPANVSEFGSAETEQGLKSLQEIDAYGHLQDHIKYPGMLLTVGLNDARVSSWQTGKFAARLIEIDKELDKANPVIIVAQQAGHTAFSRQQVEANLADTISFFLSRTSYEFSSKPDVSR